MNTVDVPFDYDPKFELIFREKRKRFVLIYFIPNLSKKYNLTLPKDISSRKKAETFRERKRKDLLRGILTQSEYQRYLESLGNKNVSIEEGLSHYQEKSTNRNDNSSSTQFFCIRSSLKWFEKNFNEAKEKKNLRSNRDTFLISNITQDDITHFRDYLISEGKKRKISEEKVEKLLNTNANRLEIEGCRKAIRRTGISMATAETKFRRLKTFFSVLHKTGLLFDDPCSEIKKIPTTKKEKARSTSPTIKEVRQLKNSSFVHPNGFPIVEFITFLSETGARKGEVLHLETNDIEEGIWKIREKKRCPSKRRMGWSPKCGSERDIALSPLALEIVEKLTIRAMEKRTVGYILGDYNSSGQNKERIAYDASFLFTIRDYNPANKGGFRRVDDVGKAWKSLLKAEGIRAYELGSINLHDFRRYRNEINEKIRGLGLAERSKHLGNSTAVNKAHYGGKLENETLTLAAELKHFKERLLEVQKERDLYKSLFQELDSRTVNCVACSNKLT